MLCHRVAGGRGKVVVHWDSAVAESEGGKNSASPREQERNPCRCRAVIVGRPTLRHRAVVELLRAHGDVQVLREVPHEADLLRLVAVGQPDVVAMEAPPSRAARVETVRALRRVAPRAALLLLPPDGACTAEVGSLGVASPSPAPSLRPPAAVRVERPAPRDGARKADRALSPRELEVLRYVALAMTNQQIARTLNITTGTVKSHLHRAFRKLGAVSRLDAVTKATVDRLIPPPPDGPPVSPVRLPG
ncbi:hypothetical protein GQS52_05015 [Streptomyces sp. SCUT-3]|nr:hypothetical protein GQS52_05015 [Streptomyces sp. SCUT-3]